MRIKFTVLLMGTANFVCIFLGKSGSLRRIGRWKIIKKDYGGTFDGKRDLITTECYDKEDILKMIRLGTTLKNVSRKDIILRFWPIKLWE